MVTWLFSAKGSTYFSA